MFGTRSARKVYNFVHADEIWKDHVTRELQSQKKWTDQWGYLLAEYQQLQGELLDIGPEVEDVPLLGKEQPDVGNVQQGDLMLQAPGELNQAATEFKIEQLTTGLGRRMQSIARGKDDIVKVLGWPREGLR